MLSGTRKFCFMDLLIHNVQNPRICQNRTHVKNSFEFELKGLYLYRSIKISCWNLIFRSPNLVWTKKPPTTCALPFYNKNCRLPRFVSDFYFSVWTRPGPRRSKEQPPESFCLVWSKLKTNTLSIYLPQFLRNLEQE